MSRSFLTKTSFTAGELDPLLRGRLDLKALEDGAARLRNVVVHPSGGVSRRPGLRYVATLPGALRLDAFDGPDGGQLVAFGAYRIDILLGGATVASITDTLWGPNEIADLSTARWGDRLLICHPSVPPKELIRNSISGWQLRDWRWEQSLDGDGQPCDLCPFARFARPEIAIQVNDGTAAEIAPGSFVSLLASEPVFTPDHIDSVITVRGKQVRIVNPDPVDRQRAFGVALQKLGNGKPTRDWQEQAFSEAHGWPRCVAVHQERLVIGGSRDVPDRLWFSKTGHPFNFDPGTGLDDEAISFRLSGDEQHDIRGLLPGRLLQVFTSSGEWIVRGAPVTAESVAVELQTRIGSWAGRRIDPLEVDGAALFVGASGRELREFLFADSEQAYQAADIALLSRHLMLQPTGLRFDRLRRWLLITRADGGLATVVLDRNSNVAAWSLLAGSGLFRSVALWRGEPYFLVDLGGRTLLERFDDGLTTDHAVTLSSAAPRTVWTGLGHLEGAEVMVEGTAPPQRATVTAGSMTAASPAIQLTVGAPFMHQVEPMAPVVPGPAGISLDRPYRPVRLVFRLLGTGALRLDAGDGLMPVSLSPPGPDGRFTGDAELRAAGWRRGTDEPIWRVEQDDPQPCTILSVTAEIMGNT
ncbi:MAG: hypothetical protein AB7I59_08175 [Geminicoccaceae bacterium]